MVHYGRKAAGCRTRPRVSAALCPIGLLRSCNLAAASGDRTLGISNIRKVRSRAARVLMFSGKGERDLALRSSGPGTAALLARCPLEEWMDERSPAWSSGSHPYPTMASKLIAMEALGEGDLGARARRLWSALSRTVRHHAYELQPSVAEVRHLVRQVRGLGG